MRTSRITRLLVASSLSLFACRPAAPAIDTQPQDVTVVAPAPAELRVRASGSDPLAFQWRKDGADLPGETNTVLRLTTTALSNAGLYSVVVSNAQGSVESRAARLTVHTVPAIARQPSAASATVGDAVSLQVEADGVPVPTYQWSKGGAAIPGATSATLSFSQVQLSDAGQYQCTVTNAAGTVTSDAVALSVVDVPPSALRYAEPSPTYVAGASATPNAPTSSGGPVTSYVVAPPLPAGLGLDGATGIISGQPLYEVDAADYQVTASNSGGSTGTTVRIRVVSGPAVTAPPSGLTRTQPAAATFTVAAGGTGPLSYQWQRDGMDIPGATSASYTLDPTALADSGATFRAVVSNPWGTATSNAAMLTVIDAPPSSLGYSDPAPTYAVDQVITPNVPSSSGGAVVSYSVSPPLYYGLALDPSTGVITGTPLYSGGPLSYTVTATNSGGSTSATVTIRVVTAARITGHPAPQTVRVPDAAQFTVVATGTAPLTYQWQRNGFDIPGATSPTYSFSPTALADDGTQFRVVVTNAGGTATSTPAWLTVRPPLAPELMFVPSTTVSTRTTRFPASIPPQPGKTIAWSVSAGPGPVTLVGDPTSNVVFLDFPASNTVVDLTVRVTDAAGNPVEDVRTLAAPTRFWSPSVYQPLGERSGYQVISLPGQRTLYFGGTDGFGAAVLGVPARMSEIRDPWTGAWSRQTLATARTDAVAVGLPDGRVFAFGGSIAAPNGARLSSIERLMPGAGAWTQLGTSLITARSFATATLLSNGKVLIAGGQGAGTPTIPILATCELFDPATGAVTATGSMTVGRSGHRAALLQDGRVLVIGSGSGNAEVYDPANGQWMATAPMNVARTSGASLTVLPTGEALVAGGGPYYEPYQSAELYDPVANQWTPTPPLSVRHSEHAAVLLPDGRVLVAGGGSIYGHETDLYDRSGGPAGSWVARAPLILSRAEGIVLPSGRVFVRGGRSAALDLETNAEYDVVADAWSIGPTRRRDHTATKLPGGKVLIVGGNSRDGISFMLRQVDLFDPLTATLAATQPTAVAHAGHTATLLPDGRVLVAGGYQEWGNNGLPWGQIAAAEIYDPSNGQWTSTAPLTTARHDHQAVLLPSGKVLVIGGYGASGPVAAAEIWDPSTGAWTSGGTMVRGRYLHRALLLNTGKVLVTGGWSPGVGFERTCELYDPAAGLTGSWATTGQMAEVRANHSMTLLPGGDVLVMAGKTGDVFADLDTVERYRTSSGTFSANTGWMNHSRNDHTATWMSDVGGVVVVGGFSEYGRYYVQEGEFWNPTTEWFGSAGSLVIGRKGHTTTLLDDGRLFVTGGCWLANFELW